jgi:hypothetical protein
MTIDLLANGSKTRGSDTILIHYRVMMNRAGAVPQTLMFGFAIPYPQEKEDAEPVHSAGDSEISHSIDNYLRSALAGYEDLASETPKRIRITSSPKARAAQMDPWRAKNGRRIRLIKKKYRDGGLNEKETAELSRLTTEIAEHVKHVAPRSTEALEEFEEYVGQLRARARNG